MGIEKDYLMHQLMMLFEVIHKILIHREKGEKQKALENIQYFYSCLNIENSFEALSIKELIHYLEYEKKLSVEQIEMIALVLKEQGELSEDKNTQKNYFRKAYFLFEKVEHESLTFSFDRQLKLNELKNYLD